MRFRHAIILAGGFATIAASVIGCAPETSSSPPAETEAQQMHHILMAFDRAGAVRFPLVRPGSVLPPEMGQPVSWYWDGPVDQAVRLLAKRLGYAIAIPPNPHPPLIAIDQDDTTMGALLDEVAAAADGQAEIDVDVLHHVIEVQWNG